MVDTYRGWIPNVSGALSFGTFGEVSHPPLPVNANRADRLTRYIVCYQARDKSDVQLPFREYLGPLLFNIQGRIWFLCIGVTSPNEQAGQDFLKGQVFLFHEKESWESNVEPLIADAQRKLMSYDFGRTEESIVEHFDHTFLSIQEKIAPFSILTFSSRYTDLAS